MQQLPGATILEGENSTFYLLVVACIGIGFFVSILLMLQSRRIYACEYAILLFLVRPLFPQPRLFARLDFVLVIRVTHAHLAKINRSLKGLLL